MIDNGYFFRLSEEEIQNLVEGMLSSLLLLVSGVIEELIFSVVISKQDHRLAALAKTDWTPTAKDEVREVLNLAHTSSDESSYEYDSDSERRVLACYKDKSPAMGANKAHQSQEMFGCSAREGPNEKSVAIPCPTRTA
ncbi:hypothetical protein P5673_011868 [Acropora cervicornis]|uniref:Uncharacterized protein n=1 Tax=Acropora cervicornis TaxID=6130 RepID=A0AAD9V823_ACRCE|nr:hypothetical protein P5673_011868 [Acropora cervicornis]